MNSHEELKLKANSKPGAKTFLNELIIFFSGVKSKADVLIHKGELGMILLSSQRVTRYEQITAAACMRVRVRVGGFCTPNRSIADSIDLF